MSNMLSSTDLKYFQIPQGFMTAERYKAFNKTQLVLYLYLWEQCNRNSSFTLKFAGKDLAEKTWCQGRSKSRPVGRSKTRPEM
jgi:hypothetical protein